jgi:hypothetical protein
MLLESAVPICLLAEVTIVREILQQRPPKFQWFEITLGRVENLAVGANERSERHGAFPGRSECGNSIRGIVAV